MEMLAFLASFHGIALSILQLKRILRCYRLGRRVDGSEVEDVVHAVEQELDGIVEVQQVIEQCINKYEMLGA